MRPRMLRRTSLRAPRRMVSDQARRPGHRRSRAPSRTPFRGPRGSLGMTSQGNATQIGGTSACLQDPIARSRLPRRAIDVSAIFTAIFAAACIARTASSGSRARCCSPGQQVGGRYGEMPFPLITFGVMTAARITRIQAFMALTQLLVMTLFFLPGALSWRALPAPRERPG